MIKEEQERLGKDWKYIKDSRFLIARWIKESNKRIAKAALEASKLESIDIFDTPTGSPISASYLMGYNTAISKTEDKIQELLKEI